MLPQTISTGQPTLSPNLFLRWIMLLLLLALLAAATTEARAATIEEIMVTNSSSHVLLYGRVANGFTLEMEDALHNGMPVTFTFAVELHQFVSIGPTRRIAALAFDHTLSYDNLKEEYRIELKEKGGRILATQTLAQARELMAEINGLRVVSLATLKPGQDYLIKVQVKLARKTLPLNVHSVIPFWGLRDFKTDWHTVEFRY
jgi:hypothetical protein